MVQQNNQVQIEIDEARKGNSISQKILDALLKGGGNSASPGNVAEIAVGASLLSNGNGVARQKQDNSALLNAIREFQKEVRVISKNTAPDVPYVLTKKGMIPQDELKPKSQGFQKDYMKGVTAEKQEKEKAFTRQVLDDLNNAAKVDKNDQQKYGKASQATFDRFAKEYKAKEKAKEKAKDDKGMSIFDLAGKAAPYLAAGAGTVAAYAPGRAAVGDPWSVYQSAIQENQANYANPLYWLMNLGGTHSINSQLQEPGGILNIVYPGFSSVSSMLKGGT